MITTAPRLQLQDVLPLPLVASFLESSGVVHVAIIDREAGIRYANPALAGILQLDTAAMVGRSLRDFLTVADGKLIGGYLSGTDSFLNESLLLNVVAVDHTPHTLSCRLATFEDGLLLLGEPLPDNNLALQAELLQLNNRLAVLSRENVRKSRELATALKTLELAHEQLDRSFWHLKKIQEVLPICMECGKVKTTDSSWEDVVSFLKNNSMFLSHGYCPECADKVMSQVNLELDLPEDSP